MSDNTVYVERRKNSGRSSDVLVVFFCLAGAAGSLYLFYQDFFSRYRSASETPAGIVVIKQNTVQRRQIGRAHV